MVALETARLLLRRFGPGDRDAYYERIFADADVMRTLPPRAAIPPEEFDARLASFAAHWERHGFGPWVVILRESGELIGHCGLRYWPDTPDVEVLYALGRPYWGRGLATEGARASLRYGFETLGLDRIIAAAFADNVGSRRVLAKLGMRLEKTFAFGGREAVGYEMGRHEFRPAPEPYRVLP